MDCIILAGNRENYRDVCHEDNKAFLPIGDKSILQIMLEELRAVPEIDRFLVVGPKKRLQEQVTADFVGNFPKPLLLFEQKNDLVENVLAVFKTTTDEAHADRYVLILPSDIPLLIAEEVRQFIKNCDMERFDYVGGLTTDKALSRFGPKEEKPGVCMAYFYCEDKRYRINNLHMVRPARIKRLSYIRKTYGMRYQKKFVNILKMIFHLGLAGFWAPGAIPFYLGLQTARWLHNLNWNKTAALLQKHFTLARLEKNLSQLLGTRLRLQVTEFGGTAIDVDNESDYLAICQRFGEWVAMQKSLAAEGVR